MAAGSSPLACRPPPPTPSRRCRRRRPSLARQLSTVGCAMSRRPASPHGCSVHSAGLGLRTRPLGGRRRLPAIADSPSGIGEPGGARAPRARAPYPRGRSFRANICDFLRRQTRLTQLCGGCLLRSYYYNRMPYMTDQGPLGRPPRGASVPGGAPCGAGPQLIANRSREYVVLEGNRENCSVSAPRRPSVQADPQGMQPG